MLLPLALLLLFIWYTSELQHSAARAAAEAASSAIFTMLPRIHNST
jgi:hypothetical protein